MSVQEEGGFRGEGQGEKQSRTSSCAEEASETDCIFWNSLCGQIQHCDIRQDHVLILWNTVCIKTEEGNKRAKLADKCV